MLEITRDLACDRIEIFAAEGRLVQGSWHDGSDGRNLACLLGAIDPSVDSPEACPASVMPSWMARLLPTLFDGVSADKALDYGKRFASALRIGNTDENVLRKFLVACVESGLQSAEPTGDAPMYWVAVKSSCDHVVELIRTNEPFSSAKMQAAARAAARAAADAAARAAADAAARAAYENLFDSLIAAMIG